MSARADVCVCARERVCTMQIRVVMCTPLLMDDGFDVAKSLPARLLAGACLAAVLILGHRVIHGCKVAVVVIVERVPSVTIAWRRVR